MQNLYKRHKATRKRCKVITNRNKTAMKRCKISAKRSRTTTKRHKRATKGRKLTTKRSKTRRHEAPRRCKTTSDPQNNYKEMQNTRETQNDSKETRNDFKETQPLIKITWFGLKRKPTGVIKHWAHCSSITDWTIWLPDDKQWTDCSPQENSDWLTSSSFFFHCLLLIPRPAWLGFTETWQLTHMRCCCNTLQTSQRRDLWLSVSLISQSFSVFFLNSHRKSFFSFSSTP